MALRRATAHDLPAVVDLLAADRLGATRDGAATEDELPPCLARADRRCRTGGAVWVPALVREVARSARQDLGLEQLRLELRSGQGLETIIERLGTQVVRCWPGALRLSEHDRRAEVLVLLDLTPADIAC